MQAGTLRWLVMGMGILTLAGCGHSQSAAIEINPVPSLQPSVSPPSPPQPLVFYDETGDPSEHTPPLSELELERTINWVATQTQNPIWLIRARPSFSSGKRAGVVAYLVPDETTSRMRVGRAYPVAVFKGEIDGLSPWEYVQVSLADQSFTDQLTKPSVTDMPFRLPVVVDPDSKRSSPMSREELIRIVDFVRQPSNYKDRMVQWMRTRGTAGQAPYELPILRMRREAAKIYVTSGFQHAGLWAHGWMITIECTASGYEITECGMWMS